MPGGCVVFDLPEFTYFLLVWTGLSRHKCVAFSVMWASLIFSVIHFVWIRGMLIICLCICAAVLVESAVISLAWRVASSIACCSLVGRSPHSVLSAVCRIGPSISPMHWTSDSSRASRCTLCIWSSPLSTMIFVVECTCTNAFHIVSVICTASRRVF